MSQTNYVLDTSALIQAFVTDSHSLKMKHLLQQIFTSPELNLHILDFGLAECLNIFWKRVMFHRLPLIDAQTAIHNLFQTPLTVHTILAYQNRALEIGVAYHLSTYDALYLALAEALQVVLVTDDEKQAQIAGQIGLSIKLLQDFP